jgi:hypothetical protein
MGSKESLFNQKPKSQIIWRKPPKKWRKKLRSKTIKREMMTQAKKVFK